MGRTHASMPDITGVNRHRLVVIGVFIFHTFPTEYDYLFFENNFITIPLLLVGWLPSAIFNIIVKFYAVLLDGLFLIKKGKTHKQFIAGTVHPNPLSTSRVENFLKTAGFSILSIQTSIDAVNPLRPGQGKYTMRFLKHQPVTRRSIFGAAKKS